MMKNLLKHLRPYKTYIAIILVLVFFQSMSELYLPTLMSDIVDFGIVRGDTPYIFKIGGLMLLVALGGALCAIVVSFLSSKVAMGFGKLLRRDVFAKVESFSLAEFNNFGTSSLITRTTNDINQLQQVLMMLLRMMLSAPMMGIGGIVMAVSKDATLSLILVVIMPILGIAVYFLGKKATPFFNLLQTKLDRLNLVVRESLTGIRVIRAFNREEHEKKRFSEANKDLTETSLKVYKMMAFLMPFMMLLLNLSTIFVIWFGGIRIDSGRMQIGELMAFIQYIMQIMFSLMMVTMMFVMIPRASASAKRVMEVLEVELELKDPIESKLPSDVKGFIEFKDVSFRYPGAEKNTLTDVSFTINPGETTAIIGGTGSGKSTLLNLIMRFYDLEDNCGSISIDGVELKEITQANLRALIGYVPQKALLFSGTIAENISYGKESATMDEINAAARIAQATEFISGFKDGFNSHIAQGGTNVSGGQKQRLSIARALVRRPLIYIFDDSFSALDFKTDAKLRAALKRETQEATKIIVAQRVSTVMGAEKIIVLDEGRVAGIGNHKELLMTCSVYKEIVASQLSEEELS